MKVAFYTLGCKVNQYETNGMIQAFLENGYELVEFSEKADVYVGQALGYRTAWSNRPIALAVMLPFLILMLLSAAKTENDDLDIPVRGKLLILGMLLIELLGMHIIFLVETSVYATTINGFQGRYFILFLPCILLLLRHGGLEFRKGKERLYPMFSMAQAVYLFFFIKMFLCD